MSPLTNWDGFSNSCSIDGALIQSDFDFENFSQSDSIEIINSKTFLSEYIVCLIISFSTSQWTKSRMIHTMYMFISSIIKWKMSYNVVHVTNPLFKGYQNKGIVNFVLNFWKFLLPGQEQSNFYHWKLLAKKPKYTSMGTEIFASGFQNRFILFDSWNSG